MTYGCAKYEDIMTIGREDWSHGFYYSVSTEITDFAWCGVVMNGNIT